MYVGFTHLNCVNSIDNSTASYQDKFTDTIVSVGNFTPKEGMNISASGTVDFDGVKYDFSLSGDLELADMVDIKNSFYSLRDSSYES